MTKPHRHDDERKLVELALQLASDGLARGARATDEGIARSMPHVSDEDRARTMANIRSNNAFAHKKIAAHLLRSAAALLERAL